VSTTFPIFSIGEAASASQVNLAFSDLEAQGNAILQTLSEIQLTTLVDYQRRLDALNARRQRAARILTPGITGFVVSDFDDINQGTTTATVRADTASATLRERSLPGQVEVLSTTFTSSSGTVQSIDDGNTLFSVYNSADVPTGTFMLTLTAVMDISLLTIDIAAMASSPSISVSISVNGLTWVPASEVQLSGYRLNAWLPQTPTKYIQIVIVPSQPDNLGGSTYTFGVTDLSGSAVSYNLVSDVFFNPITVAVGSDTVQLVADNVPGLTYYLSLNSSAGSYSAAVVPNTPITLLGVVGVNWTGGMNTSGVLALTLPGDVIPGSVFVFGPGAVSMPVAPGLSPADPNIAGLDHPHASIIGSTITVLPVPISTSGEYGVSYMTGPSSFTATLRVHLATQDSTVTPIFTGAYLEDL
jgi:hypothetical protein